MDTIGETTFVEDPTGVCRFVHIRNVKIVHILGPSIEIRDVAVCAGHQGNSIVSEKDVVHRHQLLCLSSICARRQCHGSTRRFDIVSERISFNVPEVPLCNHRSFDCRLQCAKCEFNAMVV